MVYFSCFIAEVIGDLKKYFINKLIIIILTRNSIMNAAHYDRIITGCIMYTKEKKEGGGGVGVKKQDNILNK